jgi:hypothetical protein
MPKTTALFLPGTRGNIGTSDSKTIDVVAAAANLAELTRDQLPRVSTASIVVIGAPGRADVAGMISEVTELLASDRPFAGRVFRTDWLRSALRAPLIDADFVFTRVARTWLLVNLAGAPETRPGDARLLLEQIPSPADSGEALLMLALYHMFLGRCPQTPDTKPIRRALAFDTWRTWRRHRRALPIATARRVSIALQHAPRLPFPLSLAARISFLGTAFLNGRGDPALASLCAEIEKIVPGFCGGRAFAETRPET